MKRMIAAGLACIFLPTAPAQAEDTGGCWPGHVCASDPATVVEALERAKLQPKLVADENGDPMIEARSDNWDFNVHFYGCVEKKKCDSLQFSIGWTDDGTHTPELANRWNNTKRFLQMSVTDEKDLMVRYDLATIGGVRKQNFADVLDWWEVMLGSLSDFFKEEEARAGGTAVPDSKDVSGAELETKALLSMDAA